jgi:DNA-binding NarL/FixJ family response regulator
VEIRVYACVRESILLKGLEAVFARQNDLVFCGGCVDEATLFDQLPRVDATALLYDVGTAEALPYLTILKRNFPRLRILVMLDSHLYHLSRKILARGVSGHLRTTATAEELFVSLSGQPLSHPDGPQPPARLTNREKDILRLVSMGKPNRKIARELAISETAVRYHLDQIYGKLKEPRHVHATPEERR